LRTISYLLHPPLLDELGLGSALRWYMDGFQKRSGINVRLEFSGDARLAPEMETMLFRVVQECLINIHRHSGSATASIRLAQAGAHIVLEVEDEGRGMTPEELADIASGLALGVGLRGMRERVKDFGGELEILSQGQGTKVKAVVPMQTSPSRTFPEEAAAGAVSNPAGNGPAITGVIAKRASVN